MLDANKSRVFDGVIGAADPGAVWAGLPLDRRRALIDILMTVTIATDRSCGPRLRSGIGRDRLAHGVCFGFKRSAVSS